MRGTPSSMVEKRVPVLGMLAVALLVAGVVPASAQVVRGQVVDRGTQSPLPGAFIILMDASGTRRGGVLSGTTGAFILRAPAPGRYTLRAERIGYQAAVSDTLELVAGQALAYRFQVAIEPVDLEGIEVTGKGRCRISRDSGAQTSVLWEEVRKALSIAVWGDSERGVPYQTALWSRSRSLTSLEVLDDTLRIRSGYGRTPFASESAKSLGEEGYIREEAGGGFMFYGLDAKTLLSDEFLESHCFRIESGGSDQEGLIGLGFEPLHRGGPPDIVGTLWVDRSTSELRYLEFHYDRIPMGAEIPIEPFGGRMDFMRLENGDWVVSHWWLRMPQTIHYLTAGPHRDSRDERMSQSEIRRNAERRGLRIHEQGGEVRFISAPGGVEPDSGQDITGVVYDSTRSMPLRNATVFLTDVNVASGTDVFGRFRLAHVPPGRHEIAFTHQRTDFLGLPVTPEPIDVVPGHYTSIQLGVPKHVACGPDPSTAGLVGFLEDEDDGAPLPGVKIDVAWWVRGADTPVPTRDRKSEVSVTTDARGRYVLCGLPLETEIEVRPVDGSTTKVEIDLPGLREQTLLGRRSKG